MIQINQKSLALILFTFFGSFSAHSEQRYLIHTHKNIAGSQALSQEGWRLIVLDENQEQSKLQKLTQDPDIDWIEADQKYSVEQEVFTTTEKDPYQDEQWSLVKSEIFEALKWVPKNAAPVLVAVIDTGVDLKHPDLETQIFRNASEVENNLKDDDQNGWVDDIRGWNFEAKDPDTQDDFHHGTHVSGIIGAIQNNELGIFGVAPKVKILPIRWMKNGSGWGADAIEAIHYAVKMGARIINASWGGIGYSKALEDAVREAEKKGILFVASAGNNHTNNDVKPRHPANLRYSNVISVASLNEKDELDKSSNFGQKMVELAAPGSNIISTMLHGQYGKLSGTSMAAAHVSGVAALLLAANPKLSAQEIKSILLQTVTPLTALKDKTISGGRINALQAVKKVLQLKKLAEMGVQDEDISTEPSKEKMHFSGNLIKPDQVLDGASISGLSVQFVRLVKGVETPVSGLSFKTQIHGDTTYQNFTSNDQGFVIDPICKKASIATTVTLQAPRYRVSPGTATYEMILNAKCGVSQKIVFDEKSSNGQVIGIWQMASRAHKKLSDETGISFWKRQISFLWPGAGDFYSSDIVNLTSGYAWDVVAHEMGHAIYDQGRIGVFGGGQHYIDQCYSEALAISEGWASFYAAWLNVDLMDVDARFEYMVPRRAPIRFENIPSDVCGKSTNEWRVTGFLWDLIDAHDDGETEQKGFSKLWNATFGTRASSAAQLKSTLIKKGWDAATVETIWKLNFPAE